MLPFCFGGVWLLNIICVIRKKKSYIVEALTCLFVIILFCGNTSNGDYLAYSRRYYAGGLGDYEFGFSIVGNLCNSLGISYDWFKSLIYIPCLIALYVLCNRYIGELHGFILLYFSILIFYDIVQIRNFVAAVMLLIGISCLIDGKKTRYLIVILVAISFQSVALIYLPLVFVDPKRVSQIKYGLVIAFVSMSLSIVVLLNGKQIPFLGEVLELITGSTEKLFYLTTRINWGFLIPWGLHFLNIVLVLYSENLLRNGRIVLLEHQEKVLYWSKTTMYIGLLIFPFILVNLTFDRVYRNFNYLYYILAAITMKEIRVSVYRDNRRWRIKELLYFLFIIVYGLVWHYGTLYRYGTYPTEIQLILENNFFFGS